MNELIAYQNVKDPLQFMQQMGTAMAKSRMFGCDNEAQGQVLAMACLCQQENPLAITRTYHIIDGNLSMRADAMLAEFRARGGTHKIICRTPEHAEIEIELSGQKYVESLTWEEAQQERYPYRKDGATLKTNWSTPRSRRQMLWARVCSEAVRTLCPEIVAGLYTPEETGDFVEHEEPKPKPVDPELIMRQTAEKVADQDATKDNGTEVIDAEFEVTDLSEKKPTAEPEKPKKFYATKEQRQEIRRLCGVMNVSDEQMKAALERRGAKALRWLPRDKADDLIASLKKKAGETADVMAGESQTPKDATSEKTSGPVDQATIDQIKSLMKGQPELIAKVKEHMYGNGIPKLSYMSLDSARVLLSALETKNMELFFEHSLNLAIAEDSNIPF